MRAIRLGIVFLLAASCSGRQVVVQSAPRPSAAVYLSVTNRLTQPVNVYALTGTAEAFLRQVPANATELVPVPDVAPGASVTLRARTADGTRTYSRNLVAAPGTTPWEIR